MIETGDTFLCDVSISKGMGWAKTMLTMTSYVGTDLLHGLTNGLIGVQEHVVLSGLPLGEGRDLLRDG